jgi:large subunit ribosomal protein L21
MAASKKADNTYAVVESGGKQYRVQEGATLLVDRLTAAEGDKVLLRPVMFRSDDGLAPQDDLEKVKVEATVSEHLRGKKIKVFKYKPKKGYKRRAGHRSELTRLEVNEVKLLTRKPAKAAEKTEGQSADKPVAKPKETAKKTEAEKAEKKAAPKKAPAKKPAAKASDKPAAAKKTAAKKPAAKKPAAKKTTKKDDSDGS